MPRNASGVYTLPLADVLSGTLIESSWANTTMDDLQAAMTDSLSRSGNGGMLASLKGVDGTVGAPSYSFTNDPTSGLYDAMVGDVRMSIGGVDRMRWLTANAQAQVWDNDNSVWNDIGAGGVAWTSVTTLPALAIIGTGYVTEGSQSILLPATPPEGQSIAFADLNDDWSASNFLTLDGNGNTFTQDGSATYELDLKGAFAQFSLLNGQWEIVNFGRLSDAYGLDINNLELKDEAFNPNQFINGNLDVWQRGNGPWASTAYTADRWHVFNTGTTSSVRNSTSATIGDYLQITYVTGDVVTFNQKVELINRREEFSGKTMTMSFQGFFNEPTTIPWSVWLNHAGGTINLLAGSYPIGEVQDTNFPDEMLDRVIPVTFTLPDLSPYTLDADSYLEFQVIGNLSTAAAPSQVLAVYAAKLEFDSVATPFVREKWPDVLAQCQRYYQFATVTCTAADAGTPRMVGTLRLSPSLRVVPSVVVTSSNGDVETYSPTQESIRYDNITVGVLSTAVIYLDAEL